MEFYPTNRYTHNRLNFCILSPFFIINRSWSDFFSTWKMFWFFVMCAMSRRLSTFSHIIQSRLYDCLKSRWQSRFVLLQIPSINFICWYDRQPKKKTQQISNFLYSCCRVSCLIPITNRRPTVDDARRIFFLYISSLSRYIIINHVALVVAHKQTMIIIYLSIPLESVRFQLTRLVLYGREGDPDCTIIDIFHRKYYFVRTGD